MHSRELVREHQRIVNLIAVARDFSGEQIELQAHWARYVCVLTSGLMENAIYTVYSTYAKSCSNAQVGNYVSITLRKINNPRSQKFLETARAFNSGWANELDDFLGENGRSDALDGIMSNRHLIVHGKDSGISLVRVSEYVKKCAEIIDFLEGQCGIDEQET